MESKNSFHGSNDIGKHEKIEPEQKIRLTEVKLIDFRMDFHKIDFRTLNAKHVDMDEAFP